LIQTKKVLPNRFRFKNKHNQKCTAQKHPYVSGIYIIYPDGYSGQFKDEEDCIKHVENENWTLI